MNIYFSYSTKVFNPDEDLIFTKKLAEISVRNFKKFYKNVYLITDSDGFEAFKDLNFTEVYPVLENINQKYKDVWSIGKLHAIKYIAEKNEQFCHADFDFLITKELPKRILDANVFVQSIEYDLKRLKYNTDHYEALCKNKYLAEDKSYKAFNCGIVGGKDCPFFYEYASTAIQMIEDPENEDLWLKNYPEFETWTKAVLAEQYYIACAFKKCNIYPKLIFDNSMKNYEPLGPEARRFFKETGAFHFLGKSKQKIKPLFDIFLKII